MSSGHMPIERTEMFAHFVAVANWAWSVAEGWRPFARDTVGQQLVRAVDSIGANLAEGDGRFATGDALRFFVIARASARETKYWLDRAIERKLVDQDTSFKYIDRLVCGTQMLNGLIRYRRNATHGAAREESDGYVVDEDPFSCDVGLEETLLAFDRYPRS